MHRHDFAKGCLLSVKHTTPGEIAHFSRTRRSQRKPDPPRIQSFVAHLAIITLWHSACYSDFHGSTGASGHELLEGAKGDAGERKRGSRESGHLRRGVQRLRAVRRCVPGECLEARRVLKQPGIPSRRLHRRRMHRLWSLLLCLPGAGSHHSVCA